MEYFIHKNFIVFIHNHNLTSFLVIWKLFTVWKKQPHNKKKKRG